MRYSPLTLLIQTAHRCHYLLAGTTARSGQGAAGRGHLRLVTAEAKLPPQADTAPSNDDRPPVWAASGHLGGWRLTITVLCRTDAGRERSPIAARRDVRPAPARNEPSGRSNTPTATGYADVAPGSARRDRR